MKCVSPASVGGGNEDGTVNAWTGAAADGGTDGDSAATLVGVSPRHWRAFHAATHVTSSLRGCGCSFALHFGQAGGSGSGAVHVAAVQQQPGVVPQATMQPHGFTVPDFVRSTGKPNAATACASTRTTASAGRVRRRRVRVRRDIGRPIRWVLLTVGLPGPARKRRWARFFHVGRG